MEASPSLLGQVVLGMVHRVVVLIPAPTRSISSALNERAPLRTNTLFWSSILIFPFIFRSISRAQAFQKTFARAAGGAAYFQELAFANGSISVRGARVRIGGASSEGIHAPFHKVDLFRSEIASALANQYSVLVVHSFLPLIFCFRSMRAAQGF
jgi:hypothetical protein